MGGKFGAWYTEYIHFENVVTGAIFFNLPFKHETGTIVSNSEVYISVLPRIQEPRPQVSLRHCRFCNIRGNHMSHALYERYQHQSAVMMETCSAA